MSTPVFARPTPPVFTDPEEARRHYRIRLAAALRIFGRLGYDQGIMGHLSFRDPVEPTHFWQNPFAVSFARIRASDLLRLSLDGEVIEGSGHVHPSGFRLHAKLYEGQDRVKAIAHSHSKFGKIWSTQDRLLDPLTTEAAQFHGRHILYDSFREGEAERVGQSLGDHRAMIMKNHGILTVGDSVDEAAFAFIAFERACEVQILAETTRTGPVALEEPYARRISEGYSPANVWLNFQPLFDEILGLAPDLAS